MLFKTKIKNMNAKRRSEVWAYLPKYIQKRHAQHLLKKLVNYETRVGKLVIFQHHGHCQVINEESLVVHFFDTMSEAVNFCLDNYEEAQFTTQGSLFEE